MGDGDGRDTGRFRTRHAGECPHLTSTPNTPNPGFGLRDATIRGTASASGIRAKTIPASRCFPTVGRHQILGAKRHGRRAIRHAPPGAGRQQRAPSAIAVCNSLLTRWRGSLVSPRSGCDGKSRTVRGVGLPPTTLEHGGGGGAASWKRRMRPARLDRRRFAYVETLAVGDRILSSRRGASRATGQ